MKNYSFKTFCISLLLIVFTHFSCKKLDPVSVTKFSTSLTTPQIGYNEASVTGNFIDIGEGIVSYGHCWSTSPNPTINDFKVTKSGKPGKQVDFTSQLTGLASGTDYYVRAFATTDETTIYSDEISFKTTQLMDVEGNIYKTVTIGTQTWMAENLKTTKYRNGDAIGTTSPATLDISGEVSPKYQWASNGDDANVKDYGRMYTWFAATDSRNICPAGWHLPTDAEWTTMVTYLGGVNIAGGKLKEAGVLHWESPNADADNSSGFTAVAAGARNYANFYDFKHQAYFWTATLDLYGNGAYVRTIQPIAGPIYDEAWSQERGYSVRCLKD